MVSFTKFIVLLCCLFTMGQVLASTKNGFDLSQTMVPPSEIHYGGPPKDGIPALDGPVFLLASEHLLDDRVRVVGLELNGVAKAYPLDILEHHEVVNDHFGKQPVLVTFCPLCGTAMIFSNGEDAGYAGADYEKEGFGISGLLYNSDVLFYDRETESLWSQLKMQAVSGERIGEKLKLLPAVHTSWREWREQYPDTLVLSENTGYPINYSRDPYASYRVSPHLWFPVAERDGRYPPKSWVAGIIIDGKSKAYPLIELDGAPANFEDAFAGRVLHINWSARDYRLRVHDQNGDEVPVVMSYWFAWYAFYPDSQIYFMGD